MTRSAAAGWVLTSGLYGGACGGDGSVGLFGEATGGGEGDPSGSAATAAGEDSSTAPSTGVEDSAGNEGPKLDVAAGETGPDQCVEGRCNACTAVDLLFVIDNSGSMGFYQEQLTVAFPGFVDAMFAALPPGTDLHVGVTTTHGFYGLSNGEATSNCASDHTEQEILDNFTPPDVVDTGENGAQGRLYEHEGQRWFEINTDDDPAPLRDWFAGAAARGEDGTSIEEPSAAAGYVAHAANAATNDGFIRDEGAVLVVFILSDEPDKSPEPVTPYVDMLAAAKPGCGGVECILAAGIVSQFCYDNAADQTLHSFMTSFGEPPIVGDIGLPGGFGPTPDYSGVVGDALAQVIAQKCDEIVPEG